MHIAARLSVEIRGRLSISLLIAGAASRSSGWAFWRIRHYKGRGERDYASDSALVQRQIRHSGANCIMPGLSGAVRRCIRRHCQRQACKSPRHYSKEGATLEARDKEGWTPLHWAAASNAESAVVLTLLDAGADPKAKNTNGKTVFDLIQENEKLKDTDAYWRLNDLRFE